LWAGYHLPVDPDRMAAVVTWHQDALRAYRKRDFERALAPLDDLLASLKEVDPSGQDEQVSAILNDYGFFLAEAKRLDRAIAVLQLVIARAPKCAVAYLNLADAQWASGDTSAAAPHYRRYATLMKADGKEQKIPARVGQRSAR
jgi:tetratricopeptide (TPR) repeat protein